jgi:hypothetical protein
MTNYPFYAGHATGPTHFIGICDECRTVKTFTTSRARELWETYHPHDDEEGDQ